MGGLTFRSRHPGITHNAEARSPEHSPKLTTYLQHESRVIDDPADQKSNGRTEFPGCSRPIVRTGGYRGTGPQHDQKANNKLELQDETVCRNANNCAEILVKDDKRCKDSGIAQTSWSGVTDCERPDLFAALSQRAPGI